MQHKYSADHSVNSASEDDVSTSNNLLYFRFDEDDLQSQNITSLPLPEEGQSSLLEMIRFYENINITLNGCIKPEQTLLSDTGHKMAADPLQALIELMKLTLKPESIYQVNYQVSIVGDLRQINDLLIIIPDNCDQSLANVEPLLKIARLHQQEVFYTIMKTDELLQVLEKGHLYLSLACTPENLVYARCKQNKLPVMNPDRIKRLKAHARLNFYSHLVKAEKFLKAAKSLKDDSGDGICLFMLHQATEITLRGIIRAFSGVDKRTHELSVLIDHTVRFCPAISSILPTHTAEEKYLLQVFDAAYFKSRYKPEYSPEHHVEALLLPKVEQVQQVARESFETTITQLEVRG